MEFFIKKGATLPVLKMQIVKDGRNDFRNFMEEFSRNCGFILTCNFKNRIIEPLHSRCSVIDFKISKKAIAKLATQFFKRVQFILKEENVEYDPAVVAEVINKHFPDWRRVLNELQRYSATGRIDTGILVNLQETSIKELIGHIKDKNYTEAKKWTKNNLDSDVNDVLDTTKWAGVNFNSRSLYQVITFNCLSIGHFVIFLIDNRFQLFR